MSDEAGERSAEAVDIEARIDAAFDALIEFQRGRVLQVARRAHPELTSDDLLNPHDWDGLVGNDQFNYEEGYLSGLIAAQVGIRARVFRVTVSPS